MSEPLFSATERTAAYYAVRWLEGGEPQRALSVLREVRLKRPDPPTDASSDHRETQRLRTYIEQAIQELEIDYPGHALRTLRVAVRRERLG